MMIVPDAANMPPALWQTEILAPEICAGAGPRIWRTLSCNAYMPYIPECVKKRPPPLVLSGSLPPGAVLRSAMKTAGLAVRHKAQIFEAADRQMREACPWQRTGGVVDHQMVDVIVGDAGLGKGLGAGPHGTRAKR
jgi:hypothetical protein